jgi:predicted N-acetyltransferase YhbS
MKAIKRKPYFDTDFIRIRDFLSFQASRESPNRKPWNWWIDRWNFTPTVSRAMHGLGHDDWASTIGIWECGGGIIGLALSEGEGRGERFIQSGPEELPEEILAEMFDFIEGGPRESAPLHLRIDPRFPAREAMALSRGFIKIDWSESLSWLDIEKAPSPALAEGFRPSMIGEVPIQEKARLHARAFGYAENEDFIRTKGREAFTRLRLAPDYREELDLIALGPGGDPASFVGLWYDKVNGWGILEPVGTAPEYRRRGLGKSLVGEGAVRLKVIAEGLGGRLDGIWVGSDQEFYLSIGFTVMNRWGIWKKE